MKSVLHEGEPGLHNNSTEYKIFRPSEPLEHFSLIIIHYKASASGLNSPHRIGVCFIHSQFNQSRLYAEGLIVLGPNIGVLNVVECQCYLMLDKHQSQVKIYFQWCEAKFYHS